MIQVLRLNKKKNLEFFVEYPYFIFMWWYVCEVQKENIKKIKNLTIK